GREAAKRVRFGHYVTLTAISRPFSTANILALLSASIFLRRQSAPVDIQPTRTPLEHIIRHRRFRQWLPCEDDWLDGGLQSGPPAFPLFRFFGNRHITC